MGRARSSRQTLNPFWVNGSMAGNIPAAGMYGRWGKPCIELVEKLVRERTRMLHPRVRRGTALSLQHRWWGILSMTLQRAMAHAILWESGADLHDALLEPIPGLADLATVV